MSRDFFDFDGKPITAEEWGALFEERGSDDQWVRWKVGEDHLTDEIWVSTVWVGYDINYGMPWGHDNPPQIFETYVFGGPMDDTQAHWATAEEAEIGHREMVTAVRALLVACDRT